MRRQGKKMDLVKVLRGLIILWIGFTVIYIIAPTSGIVDETEWSTWLLVVSGLVSVLKVISYVLLFLLKPLGKPLFVIDAFLNPILLLAAPDSTVPTTNLQHAMLALTSMITGGLLAMLFFSPVKETFRRKQE